MRPLRETVPGDLRYPASVRYALNFNTVRGLSALRRAVMPTLLLLALPARPDALPMWEVSGKSNAVYLLGSIHFLQPGRDSLPAGIVAAYEKADVVMFELDLDDLDAVAAQETLLRLGVDPDGRTLQALLGTEDYEIALRKARALGVDLDSMRGLEPWLAALTINQLQLAQLGFDAQSGVEQQLLRLARKDGKQVLGLETLEEQLSAMDQLPAAAQRAFLLETLEEAAAMKDEIDDVVTAWRSGDTDTLEREFLDELKSQPALYQHIVVDRNRKWAGRIDRLLTERSDYLVVVGTLHLVGPDSLIRLLQQAGHAPRQSQQALLNPTAARNLPCRPRNPDSATTAAGPRSGFRADDR